MRKTIIKDPNVPLEEDNSIQTIGITSLVCVRDKARSGFVEEAKRTWKVGKNLGLYARNNEKVVNALVVLHMEIEVGMKQIHVRGKWRKSRKI